VIVRGDIVFDRARRRVSRAGRPLSLTRKEMGAAPLKGLPDLRG
jgi:DNA-binding response OmpR family regulator